MASARVYNVMQYEKHPDTGESLISEEKIIEALESHKSIKRWAYVYHDKDTWKEWDEEANPNHKAGERKPAHWHIVFQCGPRIEVSSVAKWFGIPENFVDIPKGRGAGKFIDCVEYLTHETAKQQQLGKYRYPDDAVHASDGFDWRKLIDHRNANREEYGCDMDEKTEMRMAVLHKGKTLRECDKDNPVLAMEDMDKLKKLRLEYINRQKPPLSRINFYVYGLAGVGKDQLAVALARSLHEELTDDDDIMFSIGSDKVSLDGYDGQPVIIWHDKRGEQLVKQLGGRENVFNVFDTFPHKVRQNVKFGSVNLINTVNIITGQEDYETFLNGIAGEEDANQSYRRFPIIIPVRDKDFDILLNRGYMQDRVDMYREYLQYSNIRGNMARIAAACHGHEVVRKQLERKLLQPVLDRYNEIEEKNKPVATEDAELLQMFADVGTVDGCE